MNSKVAVLTLALSLSAAPAALASKENQTTLQKEAKISMAKAREIALKKAPGKIESAELEREHGKLIYSFDIRQAGKTGITEVAVDAINGKIVDVHHETPAKEAAEKKQEIKEKKASPKKQ
jgi:uncharacterized membrane protein YkoI